MALDDHFSMRGALILRLLTASNFLFPDALAGRAAFEAAAFIAILQISGRGNGQVRAAWLHAKDVGHVLKSVENSAVEAVRFEADRRRACRSYRIGEAEGADTAIVSGARGEFSFAQKSRGRLFGQANNWGANFRSNRGECLLQRGRPFNSIISHCHAEDTNATAARCITSHNVYSVSALKS